MSVILRSLSKVYEYGVHAVHAVKNLNIEVQAGEFFTLLGPSGCGKTTTLRMVAGLETPTSGQIYLGGEEVTEVAPRKRDVAMVFQSYALYPHMTAYENLTLNLKVHHVPRREIEERAAVVAKMLGISHLLKKKPQQLSGGERQRVALGRAIIRRPKVFLLDEPLSNLDLKLRETMRLELKRLHEELKITTLYVSHDQGEAMVLSDKMAVMHDGVAEQIGTPEEIYHQPANIFVAKFVGSPTINLLRGFLIIEAGATTFCLARLADRADVLARYPLNGNTPEPTLARACDQEVILGVRAEEFVVHYEPRPGLLRTEVDFLEHAGSVNYAILKLVDDAEGKALANGDRLIAAVSYHERLVNGQPLWLGIGKQAKTKLFAAESGQTLQG
jgi:multiple sugar transport system ATP-binding protein